MRQANIFNNDILAGILIELDNQTYQFEYDENYFANTNLPPISVTISKQKKLHTSTNLFPFFYNMLSEGVNKKIQCRILKIDEEDDFGLLLKTTAHETIGAIIVEEINGT
jgi:HipA-like protein